jgi:DNA primase catalytic core
MARIPEDEIERLKREIAVERLAVAKGVELKRHGKDLVGRCPFHEDRTPSLVITPEKNVWHCLGACQAGGSVIDWVMRAEGVSFRLACELLREDSPSLAAALPAERRGRQQGPVPKKSTTPKLATLERSADDDVLMRQVVDYYHATLKESPEALTYLQRRGLVSGEMIDRFKLGFANRTLAYRLPSKNRKVGDELRGQLQRLGILRESGHEHLTGSLVIPIFDEAGRVTELYGRKITPGLRPGTPMHLYLPGPHEGVWNAPALGSSKQVILCEALIDALTFWCAGFRCVTASYGVEGFTDDHMAAFRKHGTEQVLIAYDRDDAGDRAAAKLAETLMAEGIECFRVLFPRGMDANDYARKMTPAPKTLELVLRQAQWMGRGTPKPVVVEPPVTAMPVPPTSTTPTELGVEVPTTEIAGEPIVVVGETKTIIADADGVVLEEIEHGVVGADPHPSLVAALPAAAPPDREPELMDVGPVLPAAPTTKATTTATTTNDEVIVKIGDRRWRVRGLSANTRAELMKVNVLVSREGAGFHVDALDLYSARQRAQYTTLAATEIGVEERVVKKDMGELLLKLEELRDKGTQKEAETKTPKLSEEEQQAALELLRDPKLLERILGLPRFRRQFLYAASLFDLDLSSNAIGLT